LLRVQTFTLAIYHQMSGRFDYQGAAGLSLVLIVLTLTLLIIERFFRRKQRYYMRAAGPPRRPQARGVELVVIWGVLGSVALLALAVPLGWMFVWTGQALADGAIGSAFW